MNRVLHQLLGVFLLLGVLSVDAREAIKVPGLLVGPFVDKTSSPFNDGELGDIPIPLLKDLPIELPSPPLIPKIPLARLFGAHQWRPGRDAAANH